MNHDIFWGLSSTGWTGITALLTGLLFVTAVVAAIYAAKQVKIAHDQGIESRKAQAEASRPYVIVTIESSQASQHLFDLVVRNIGQRPAVDVSIFLDPPPLRAAEPEGHEMAKAKMFNAPVAIIAPGQDLRAFYDSRIERNAREDLPTFHRVTLSYCDSSGHAYNETSVLDLEAMRGSMFTTVKTVHDIGKTLAEMQKTLKSASVLGRRGVLDVKASVEPYADQRDRVEQERAEARAQHDRMVERLLPQQEVDDQES